MSRPPVLAVTLALAGCLHDEPAPVAAAPTPDPAATVLVEAALRAEASLAELARVRAALVPAAAPEVPRAVPPELLPAITLDWTGPLAGLVEELADLAGYRFVTAGRRPVRPLLVEVSAVERPLLLVLRDAGVQAADGAVIEVDPDRRLIALTWSPGSGVGPSAAGIAPASISGSAPTPTAAPRVAVESGTVPPLADAEAAP